MPVEDDIDRLALLEDFGIDAVIGGETILVIFDNDWLDINGHSVNGPVITTRAIDVDGHVKGAAIVLNQTNYTFAESPHDDEGGLGMVNIILQRT